MTDSMAAFLFSGAVFLLQLLLMGGFVYFVVRRLRTKRQANFQGAIETLPDGSRNVPMMAAFAGVLGVPWMAVATNNANPSLVIGPSGITFRVIRKQTRAFSQIAQVDVQRAYKTVNLVLEFHGERLTFAANVGTLALAREALALFPVTIPMTPRAKAILAGTDE